MPQTEVNDSSNSGAILVGSPWLTEKCLPNCLLALSSQWDDGRK